MDSSKADGFNTGLCHRLDTHAVFPVLLANPHAHTCMLPPQVFFYTMTGVRVSKQVSFGPQLEAEGISQACLYPDGIVVLGASSNQLWAVVGLQEPRATRLPGIPGLTGVAGSTSAVSCLAVLEPQFTLSSGLEVGRESRAEGVVGGMCVLCTVSVSVCACILLASHHCSCFLLCWVTPHPMMCLHPSVLMRPPSAGVGCC